MILYPFKHVEDERYIDLAFRPDHAPRIGEVVKAHGEHWRRIPSGSVSAQVGRAVHGYPRVSNALPRNMPGADATPDGKPIIRSQRHERELQARHGLTEMD